MDLDAEMWIIYGFTGGPRCKAVNSVIRGGGFAGVPQCKTVDCVIWGGGFMVDLDTKL